MDPLTLAAIAAGGQALSAIPSIIPTKTERANKKELEALQRRQELGTLGLSDEERRQLEESYAMKQGATQAAAEAQRNRLLQGGMGVSGGQALLSEAALAEAETNSQVASQQAIEAANLAKAQQEEQQIRDLQATLDETAMARREAIGSIPMAGVGAYTGQLATEQLLSGGLSGKELQGAMAITKEFGLTQDEATKQLLYLKQNNKKLYDFYTNPEATSYLSMLGGM
jgi:hypothetical protein